MTKPILLSTPHMGEQELEFVKEAFETNWIAPVGPHIEPILTACNRYEVPLIEDAAESLGAIYKGRSPGNFGRISIFSFNGSKIIRVASRDAITSVFMFPFKFGVEI